MKKYWIIMLAAVVALVSCRKEVLDPVHMDEPTQPAAITFHLDANHPADTRAVKSGWEQGDAIFVFFSGVAAPKHLKMTYNGSSWTSEEYDGSTHSAGALGLENGDTGTMRAVFLPFGSDATVSANGTSFTFSTTYYAYYLTATLSYTVADNEVSGAFDMTIPSDYVQFFIEDANAVDGAYTLGADMVKPVGVASIAANGNITEASLAAGKDMVGYAYQGGYLFSGKLVSWNYGKNYYFYKTKTADGSRADYFAQPTNAIASHGAVKLPGNDTERWITVGANATVDMGSGAGTWYTCNYDCQVPEQVGTTYEYNDAIALPNITLPTVAQLEAIGKPSGNFTRTLVMVHGQKGIVVKSKSGSSFLFLPVTTGNASYYWSSDMQYGRPYAIVLTNSGGPVNLQPPTGRFCGVRSVQN